MKEILAAVLLIASIQAYALTGFLVSKRMQGEWKYCYYSTGQIVTIRDYQLCPLQISGYNT